MRVTALMTLGYWHDIFNKIHIQGLHHLYELPRSQVRVYFMWTQWRGLIGPGSSIDSHLSILSSIASVYPSMTWTPRLHSRVEDVLRVTSIYQCMFMVYDLSVRHCCSCSLNEAPQLCEVGIIILMRADNLPTAMAVEDLGLITVCVMA